MSAIKAITPGERFGRWTALEATKIHIYPSGKRLYCHEFRCDCGTTRFVANFRVRSGQLLSCGCLRNDMSRKKNIIHGYSDTRIYRIWGRMIVRCTKKNITCYKNYGGRGITVCERWLKFENFLADMGEPPEGYSIDRLDNDGPYAPENCAWKTKKQQARNRRTTIFLAFKGESLPLIEWAERLGVSYPMLKDRYHQGWTAEDILTKPKQSHVQAKVKCEI